MGLLSSEDKERIKRVIPKSANKIIDATVGRLYIAYPSPTSWTYTGLSGAIVLVDDLVGKTYFLKLVDINGHRGVIWDQELYVNIKYNQDRSFFHTFELESCLAGILFEDESEASHFFKRVTKREKYASKATVNNKTAIRLTEKAVQAEKSAQVSGPRGDSGNQRQRFHLNSSLHSSVAPAANTDSSEEYYDGEPPLKWRALYAELASAGITEDMIAENRDFIKNYIRQQGGPLVGLEPPIPRKFAPSSNLSNGRNRSSSIASNTSSIDTQSRRAKLHPPPPPPPPPSSSTAAASTSSSTSSLGRGAPPPPPPPPAASTANNHDDYEFSNPSTASSSAPETPVSSLPHHHELPPAPAFLGAHAPSHHATSPTASLSAPSFAGNRAPLPPPGMPSLPSRTTPTPPLPYQQQQPPALPASSRPPPPILPSRDGGIVHGAPMASNGSPVPPPPPRRTPVGGAGASVGNGSRAPPPPPSRQSRMTPQTPAMPQYNPYAPQQQQQPPQQMAPSLPPMPPASSRPVPPPMGVSSHVPPAAMPAYQLSQQSPQSPVSPPSSSYNYTQVQPNGSNPPVPPPPPPAAAPPAMGGAPAGFGSAAPPPPPPPMPQMNSAPAGFGSAAPPAPPPPPMGGAPAGFGSAAPPAPPPPPMGGAPAMPAAPSMPLPAVSGDRNALLDSIRSSGIASLKKVDKSQLDKPSVILQEARGESPTAPSSGGGGSAGGAGGLADALAAALSKRNKKLAASDDESDGEDW